MLDAEKVRFQDHFYLPCVEGWKGTQGIAGMGEDDAQRILVRGLDMKSICACEDGASCGRCQRLPDRSYTHCMQ